MSLHFLMVQEITIKELRIVKVPFNVPSLLNGSKKPFQNAILHPFKMKGFFLYFPQAPILTNI